MSDFAFVSGRRRVVALVVAVAYAASWQGAVAQAGSPSPAAIAKPDEAMIAPIRRVQPGKAAVLARQQAKVAANPAAKGDPKLASASAKPVQGPVGKAPATATAAKATLARADDKNVAARKLVGSKAATR
jgi:hypothetical protein